MSRSSSRGRSLRAAARAHRSSSAVRQARTAPQAITGATTSSARPATITTRARSSRSRTSSAMRWSVRARRCRTRREATHCLRSRAAHRAWLSLTSARAPSRSAFPQILQTAHIQILSMAAHGRSRTESSPEQSARERLRFSTTRAPAH